jgi:hypothetical protein
VNIQASNRALEFKPFLIGHTQYVGVKEKDQLKKNSQFELHNKTYHNLLTGLIISDDYQDICRFSRHVFRVILSVYMQFR